jgi:hypothetical protein
VKQPVKASEYIYDYIIYYIDYKHNMNLY